MKVKEILRFTEWIPNPQKTGKIPRFSIMMPIYRRFASGHLTRAIQSVLNQTYEEFELLMIDDGSEDGSFDEIQRFMKLDPRIHCLRHPRNVGLPALGCYEAYLKSRGTYLMFCFDDAEYRKDALERTVSYVSKFEPQITFGYIDMQSQYPRVNGKDQQIFLGKYKIPQSNLVINNTFPNLGAVLNRNLPNEIGFLDPHFAIARLTDWDYWKRAAEVYELQYSGVYIGTEFGLVTGNSLGATYPLNQWMAYEWMGLDRNSALTPGNYEEYDVQLIPDNISDHSKLSLQEISRFYENKFWYRNQTPFSISNTHLIGDLDHNAKFLVITSAQSASVTLTFEFVPGVKQSIRYASPIYHQPEEMITASAVIFARDLLDPEIHRWVEIARQLNIPHYYYFDDNLMILSEEVPELREYNEEKLEKELVSFSGVLVSNPKLADFVLEKHIHTKVYIFPPAIPSEKWLDRSRIPRKEKGVTRIGFIGGPHRHKAFIDSVLPAIARLAKDLPAELVISGDLEIPSSKYPQLKIFQFPFDISYRLTLGHMQSADIDILVHAGTATRNNPYKTHNVLLNAWLLQAFPILANQPPYENVEKLGLGLLCNNEEEWYDNLHKAVSEPILVSHVHENLQHYVNENFSGRQNFEVLKLISRECPAPGVTVIDYRYKLYIDLMANWSGDMARGSSRIETIIRRNRSWLLPPNSPQERFAIFIFRNFLSNPKRRISQSLAWNPLLAQGMARLVHKLEYKLRPQAFRWTGFEFMIGTHQNKATGHISIEIIDQTTRKLMRHRILELNELYDNQIIEVDFDEIYDSKDRDFTVRFLLRTPGPDTTISIYENNVMETKIIQIMRRLGLLIRGNTLACHLLYANQREIDK